MRLGGARIQVEAQTRKDMEGKKVQMRTLVGDSYSELITSAVVVVDMAATCARVTSDIAHIQTVFTDLQRALSAGPASRRDLHSNLSSQQGRLHGTRFSTIVQVFFT